MTKTISLNDTAKITLTYDEASMKLSDVQVQNDGDSRLFFEFGNGAWDRIFEVAENVSIKIPASIRPVWRWLTAESKTAIVGGFEWMAYRGA